MTDEYYPNDTPEQRRLRWAGAAKVHCPSSTSNFNVEGQPAASFVTRVDSSTFKASGSIPFDQAYPKAKDHQAIETSLGDIAAKVAKLEVLVERLQIQVRNHIWASEKRPVE